MVFENTSEVIQAENVLKKEGWEIRVMGPPPEIQSGCDLVIEFPLIEELNILRTLEREGVPPLEMVPIKSPPLLPVIPKGVVYTHKSIVLHSYAVGVTFFTLQPD
ncbi:MAG: DUF3343 domain-containing protein [Deltaproteobacteria bacterium]|nr:DUF3343 domain-containing protein [Deltaproteobacteria bacterium]